MSVFFGGQESLNPWIPCREGLGKKTCNGCTLPLDFVPTTRNPGDVVPDESLCRDRKLGYGKVRLPPPFHA